jgi:hypothetical protein
MVTTQCPNCGAIEHIIASIGANCYFCMKAKMKLKSYDL